MRIAAAFLVLLIAGCGASVGEASLQATASLSPSPTVQPTVEPSPDPTPEPTPDLAALGEQFLALLEPGNRHICSLTDAITGDLAAYKAFMSTVADNERAITDELRQIEFPPDIQRHVDTRIETGASYHSVLTLIAAASSFQEVDALLPRMQETNLAARDASNLIRGDLGLPGSPTCEDYQTAP